MQDDLQKVSYRIKMTIINATRDVARSFAETQAGELWNSSISNNSIIAMLSNLNPCECSGKASETMKQWSRHQRHSKTIVLKNLAIFTGKNMCWSLFWTPTQVFSKEFQNLKNICEHLPLHHHYYFMSTLSLYIDMQIY